jgi:hypothetical protein
VRTITITAAGAQVTAELRDTPTVRAIWAALPIEAPANIWGDEIYFGIPLDCEPEPDARADVAVGELGYWPPGNAFCIFFGRTPASSDDLPRAASPVNVVGRIIGDATCFRGVRSGERVRIERCRE